MKTIAFALTFFVFLSSCKQEVKQSDNESTSSELLPEGEVNPVLSEAETIAYKNGFENWKNIEEIQFTFNVARNGKTQFSRGWTWNPNTDDVTMTLNEETIAYNRRTMDSTHRRTDGGFINDKYWLLAPYNLIWDKGTTITTEENSEAPISKEKLKKLTLTYPKEGGYTPGDAYDFYYGPDFIIKEWVFREGNQEEASMMTTWEDYQDFEGLHIAKMHKGTENDFQLFFTDIAVKTK